MERAATSPYRSHTDMGLGSLEKRSDLRKATFCVCPSQISSHRAGEATPKKLSTCCSLSTLSRVFSIHPRFAILAVGKSASQFVQPASRSRSSRRASASRYCCSRLLQNRAGMSNTRSSCRAVSDVMGALPFTISLIVFRESPVRSDSSACVIVRSSSTSSSVSPGGER